MEETKQSEDLEQIEIKLLLEGIYRHYGYDFREYAPASLRRRIWNVIQSEKLQTISGLQEQVLHDPACMERFVLALSVNVTAMFRDPEFYRVFRKKVVPLLRTYPSIKIWHAGCSTGEEVYSMAIVLEEEGLLDRCTIYATDINEAVLKKARDGIFPLEIMKEYTANYLQSGGNHSFSKYYTAGYGSAILRPPLGRNIVFAQHNLVTDGPFNQFHVIWCRNVTIYFNKTLQRRVHHLLYESLITLGALGLGSKETLKASPYEEKFDAFESGQPLYRKIG